MAELWLYHLEREGAEVIVPQLLRRGLERGLRLSLETSSPEMMKAWSGLLWSAEDTGFLAHGMQGEVRDGEQPILLACSNSNVNGSHFRFYVDGTVPDVVALRDLAELDRASIFFDGHNETAVAAARALWKAARETGLTMRYLRQDSSGAWSEEASSEK
jgi:DNA polymerase III subunit chi